MTTDDMMTLRALLEKTSDADLLREMIGFTAERLMALEVEGLTGAAHGERTPERITHRNGYRERSWETRAGTVTIGSSGGWPASHSWREPSPAFAGAGSDAASCRRRVCADAGGGARRAGAPATPAPRAARSSWSSCSSTRSRAGRADGRGSASPSSPYDGCDTAQAPRPPDRPGPGARTPCPAGGRTDPPTRPPRNAAGSAGTSAPTSPATPPHPSLKDASPRTAPARRRTSPSCVPVAMPSGSSRSLPKEKPNRTDRVLPKPDRSSASDSKFAFHLGSSANPYIVVIGTPNTTGGNSGL